MQFEKLVEIVADEPVFESGLLVAGETGLGDLRRQLSRWTRSGKLWQFRRGLYALAPPFQKVNPHLFVVANRLVQASYVSAASALSFHGMIPEPLAVVTSVTTRRAGLWQNPAGRFQFQHVRTGLFFGYRATDLGGGQQAFVATPEKALVDLVYLVPGADAPGYLGALRLQHLEKLDEDALRRIAEDSGKPKLKRAAGEIAKLIREERDGYEPL